MVILKAKFSSVYSRLTIHNFHEKYVLIISIGEDKSHFLAINRSGYNLLSNKKYKSKSKLKLSQCSVMPQNTRIKGGNISSA